MTQTKYTRKAPDGNGKPVFVDGMRTPFVKSFGVFENCDTLTLFSRALDGLMRKLPIDPQEIDEIIAGVVIPQTKNPNVARDSILNLKLPSHIHGQTINRACTSSLQAVADASRTIRSGDAHLILAGGVECLSDVPIVYSEKARKFLVHMNRAKSTTEKLNILKQFSAKAWLPSPPSMSEPLTGLTMGESGEVMAKKNEISRAEQDAFAARSHQKAWAAQEKGYFREEIVPVWVGEKFQICVKDDNVIRSDTSIEAMSKLRPAFDRHYGTLTAGNSSPLTDGASIALIGDEDRCRTLGLKPKLRILDSFFVGIDPYDQLLIGPAIAIPKILERNNLKVNDIDRFEIHEAFAAQVISCLKAMESKSFAEQFFGSKPLGPIPEDRLNVNGGAIALGHPFGATGTRLLTTIANDLIRSNKELGVIAICAAGGMAGAMLVQRYDR